MAATGMTFKALDGDFSVCRIGHLEGVDFAEDFLFVGKTDRELSLVCRTAAAPGDALAREDGWKAFRIEGNLDFSLVGVLARIAAILAGEGISIFVLSTYATDYILVKKENFARTLAALERNGYQPA